ncbi:hypothetical protein GEV33_002771 [Tenebrio molitor]|uniref:Uncharacterized protein n=1 Tax=Tenebrio molitor TaxID=7067 RepID=A0A8J6HSN5_TENMO|nr:hypothetical protein GEV33_002771 [Tenebrio molitor]
MDRDRLPGKITVNGVYLSRGRGERTKMSRGAQRGSQKITIRFVRQVSPGQRALLTIGIGWAAAAGREAALLRSPGEIVVEQKSCKVQYVIRGSLKAILKIEWTITGNRSIKWLTS